MPRKKKKKRLYSYLLHDVLYFVLLTVQDHPALLLVLKVLEQGAVSLVFPLVLQVPHVDGRHLPLPLCSRVQNDLQRCQACEWEQSWYFVCLI